VAALVVVAAAPPRALPACPLRAAAPPLTGRRGCRGLGRGGGGGGPGGGGRGGGFCAAGAHGVPGRAGGRGRRRVGRPGRASSVRVYLGSQCCGADGDSVFYIRWLSMLWGAGGQKSPRSA
jgi:hypothetical protein